MYLETSTFMLGFLDKALHEVAGDVLAGSQSDLSTCLVRISGHYSSAKGCDLQSDIFHTSPPSPAWARIAMKRTSFAEDVPSTAILVMKKWFFAVW